MIFRKKRQSSIQWETHTNPDGSKGGHIASGATIGKNVYVAKTALVLPEATVPDGTTIGLGVIFTEDGPIRL